MQMTEDLIYVARNLAHAVDKLIDLHQRPISITNELGLYIIVNESPTIDEDWRKALVGALNDRDILSVKDGKRLSRVGCSSENNFIIDLYDVLQLFPDKRLVDEIVKLNWVTK
jgi:hypothetical protein